MRIISVAILMTAVLGLLAHLGGFWVVYSRNTAGFAVALRNIEIVSTQGAHAIGLFVHLAGVLLSAATIIGSVQLFRSPSAHLCAALGLGVSIPALSPLFGLAIPLGVVTVVFGVRFGRPQEQTCINSDKDG